VAGAISTLLRHSLRFFRRFDGGDVAVRIVEHGDRILGPMPESLARAAHDRMVRNGIEIRTGTSVTSVSAEGLHLDSGELIPAGTIVSAVGNRTNPLIESSGFALERGRLVVAGDMRVEGAPGVWALGDCAAVPNAFNGKTSPMLAQHATRQATQLARNIRAEIDGQPTHPFHFKDLGIFATIGHRSAVGKIFGMRLTGVLAYLLWHVVYWMKMPTIGRKVQIALDWFLNLFLPPSLVEIPLARTREDDEGTPPTSGDSGG
jgi:NADH dehydrogenase